LVPNFPALTARYRLQAHEVSTLTSALSKELRSLTRPGERVFFLSYDGSHNDYLANYLAPLAKIRTYNAGGDKNDEFAMRSWPPAVLALAGAQVTPSEARAALASGQVDVIIAPYFSLRWSGYAWPPQPDVRAQALAAFGPILRDPHLRIERRQWLVSIRL